MGDRVAAMVFERGKTSAMAPQDQRVSVASGIICATLACLLGSSAAIACPFCNPGITLTERIDQAHECYLVEWVDAREGDADRGDTGSTRVRIAHVYKSAKSPRRPGDVLTLPHFSPGDPGRASLLFSQLGDRDVVLWDGLKACSPELQAYLANRPLPQVKAPARLPYFIPYLEHPDEEIAVDAYSEFANASYDAVRSVAPQMPTADLLRWAIEPAEGTGRFTRVGFYGMVVGLCGGEAEAAALERTIHDVREARIGIEGLMGGYLLLRGEAGLQNLMQHVLSPATPSSEIFALQQATQFIGEYAQDCISRPALCQALHPLVDNPQFAELVLVDLARWEDLSLVEGLIEKYGHPDFSNQPTQTAIARYYLAMSELDPAGRSEADQSLIRQAGQQLEALRVRDPELVTHAGRFLRQTGPTIRPGAARPPLLEVPGSETTSRQFPGGRWALWAATLFSVGVVLRQLWRRARSATDASSMQR